MIQGERIGTDSLNRLRGIDVMRWVLAVAVVAGGGAGALWQAQNWVPSGQRIAAAEPAILLELAPLPEPVAEPEPVPEPVQEEVEEPTVEPPPVAEEPVPEPVVEEEPPPPEVEQVVEPEPEVVELPPEPEPEPEVVPPEPEPEPEPVPPEEAELSPLLPMTMSPRLQQQRAETPPTPRPQAQPRPKPQAAPAPKPAAQAQPQQAAPPAAPVNTVSPQQWQQQALRRIDSSKVYPQSSRSANETGSVVISFVVSASGQISSIGVARSSGYPALDQAAIDTARRASPLPPPPPGIAGQPMNTTIRFTLR